MIPICIPNHYYYHYCQAFEGLSRLSCWLSLPPLILLTPIDQVPKQIYNQTFDDYLHGLSGELDLPANIYCCLNALSAHSDPTNIGAASDQRSSSSSAATAGVRRSFRFDYLSEQSEIGRDVRSCSKVVHSANLAHHGDSSSSTLWSTKFHSHITLHFWKRCT